MKKYLVSLYKWESPQLFVSNQDFQIGDEVVVETEFGNDLAMVESNPLETREDVTKNILRRATDRDIKSKSENEKKVEEIHKICRSEIRRMNLEMKLIGAHITLDGSNTVIFFTADGRIDFRELVKNLSRIFHRSIRMQQIGSRDEARKLGGCGICGRELCCVKFPGSLPSITTDMARIQQIAHRGTERISGLCGRLMCCLAYEADQYREMLVGMPELHSIVMTKGGKGEVIEINAIKQEVKVRLGDGQIEVFKKEDIK